MGVRDKARNMKDKVMGGAKARIGGATDNRRLQADGRAQTLKGRVGQAAAKVREIFGR